MSNLIVNAFAFKRGYGSSMQLSKTNDDRKIATYLENAFVSLVSAKQQNPSDRVMFVTNVQIKPSYQIMFENQGIELREVPFETFVMPENFVWALAYYKLCVLYYLADEESFERLVLLDTDTYSVQPFDDLWKETNQNKIILFEVGHPYSHPDRQIIIQDYTNLYPGEIGNPTHYGGEFVCGTKECIQAFMGKCMEVYRKMEEKDFDIHNRAGDETILSIAAERIKDVLPANPYIYRFWTQDFYLVSTQNTTNPVCIWHLPMEKELGIRYLYRIFQKKKHFPSVEKASKLLGLPSGKRRKDLMYWYLRVLRKTGIFEK